MLQLQLLISALAHIPYTRRDHPFVDIVRSARLVAALGL